MSKRLQVLLPDSEMAEIEKLAKRDNVSVGAWVRRTLREARERKPVKDAETKLQAVQAATAYSFPIGDIDQMLAEIERGYQH